MLIGRFFENRWPLVLPMLCIRREADLPGPPGKSSGQHFFESS